MQCAESCAPSTARKESSWPLPDGRRCALPGSGAGSSMPGADLALHRCAAAQIDPDRMQLLVRRLSYRTPRHVSRIDRTAVGTRSCAHRGDEIGFVPAGQTVAMRGQIRRRRRIRAAMGHRTSAEVRTMATGAQLRGMFSISEGSERRRLGHRRFAVVDAFGGKEAFEFPAHQHRARQRSHRARGQFAFHVRQAIQVSRQRFDLMRAEVGELCRRHHRQRPRAHVHAVMERAIVALVTLRRAQGAGPMGQVAANDAGERHLVQQHLAAEIVAMAVRATTRSRQLRAFVRQRRTRRPKRHRKPVVALQALLAQRKDRQTGGRRQQYRCDDRTFQEALQRWGHEVSVHSEQSLGDGRHGTRRQVRHRRSFTLATPPSFTSKRIAARR